MVLVIAAAGLVYELVIATVASYVLGDTVTQFSTVIGVYLSALGLGAYVSRWIEHRLALVFIDVELSAALVGGLSAPALLAAAALTDAFQLILYATVVLVGMLVGLELPLLIRILRRAYDLRELIAKSLTFDYAGALVGSLAFSLLLLPRLGLANSSLVCGLLNAGVGLLSTWVFGAESAPERRALRRARVRALVVLLLLGGSLLGTHHLEVFADTAQLGGKIVVSQQSAYQHIVLARHGTKLALYLNGHLQFDSSDEHRYHEALVHPAMGAARSPRRVLIGGGGDGLAAREVLRWPDVLQVTLVDLDPLVTSLGRDHPSFVGLNEGALTDPRLTIVNADAMVWFAASTSVYDVILLDFPDPSTFALGKLFSRRFFQEAARILSPDGALAAQATSPLFARHAYWCIVETLRSVGLEVRPYRAFVPSFGEWGFALATHGPSREPHLAPELKLRYLDPQVLTSLFRFAPDMQAVPVRPNTLNNQALVGYYQRAQQHYD